MHSFYYEQNSQSTNALDSVTVKVSGPLIDWWEDQGSIPGIQ